MAGLLFGATWVTAAVRAAGVFILAYVVPALVMAPASRSAAFLKLFATVLAYVLTAGAIYKLLQSRSVADWVEEEAPETSAPPAPSERVPVAARTAEATEEEKVDSADGAAPVQPDVPVDVASLGQVALERLCMALYQFNGLHSKTVATGVPGEYRIRLVPRNTDKAIAILQCSAGSTPQGVVAYERLLDVMEEEGLEKAFFVAPAGFVSPVVAEARSRHVTLVDHKLLLALIDRLPDSAREVVFAAAT